jgi:hypothetical protein
MLRAPVALPLPLPVPETVVELRNPDDVFVDGVVLLEDGVVLLEEEVVLLLERQVPSPFGLPLKHLQLLEHGSPTAPLLLPSSHSSPRLDSQIPLPQPAGVAPRLIMYGRPEWPSPND